MRFNVNILCLCMMCMLLFSTTAFCTDVTNSLEQTESTGDEALDSITDYMKGYNPINRKSMEKAHLLASPVASMIGTSIGVINALTVFLIFLVTSLDLLYISVPFTRNFLYPSGGGMSTGMQEQSAPGHKWVSDEAVQALNQVQPQSAGGGMPQQGGGIPQQAGGKSVILCYFRKRIIFLVIFAIATTILMSSLFLKCGINLAELLYKVLEMVMGGI